MRSARASRERGGDLSVAFFSPGIILGASAREDFKCAEILLQYACAL